MDDTRHSSADEMSTISPTSRARARPCANGPCEDSREGSAREVHRSRHIRVPSYEIQYPTDTDVRNINRLDDADDADKWLNFLEEQYMESTKDEGTNLHTAMQEAANRLTSESNSICGPRPLFAILPTYSFKAAMLVLVLLHFYVGLSNFLTADYSKSFRSTSFHFEVVELREPSHPVTTTNIVDLGIKIHSCNMHGATANASGSTVSLRFDRPVVMDGFFLSCGGSDPSLNPAKIRVTYLDLTSSEHEEKVIMQPKWWTDWGQEYASSEIWEIQSSPQEESTTTTSMRTSAPPAWAIGIMVESFIVFVGCSVTLLTVFLGMYHLASRALSLTLFLLMLESLALWILLLATEDSRLSWRWLRALAVSGLLSLCISMPSYEKALIPVFLLAAVVNLSLLLSDHILVRGIPSTLLRTQELYVGCAMLSVGILLAILYSRMLKSVRLLVKQDKQTFDDVWKQILSTTPVDTIEELWRTVKLFSPSSTRGRPVQQIRASRDAWPVATPTGIPGEVAGTPERERSFIQRQHGRTLLNSDATKEKVEAGPVQSLDQLYAQATSAAVLLRRKAQLAALASDGAFPVTPRPAFRGPEGEAQQFMTLSEMQQAGMPLGPEGHEGHEEHQEMRSGGGEGGESPAEERSGEEQDAQLAVQWTDLKPFKRAIDKVLKQYHGEVHRLLDVCRETIIFEDFLGIASCIRALASDPHVVIERIKNSLDPSLDASPTAGFRAVSLNLRIVSPLSRWLCVDGHVCELLLTLRPLAQCMTHQSHQQYLQLRNFRVASRIPGLLSTLLPFGRWVGHTPLDPPLPLTSPRVLNSFRQGGVDPSEWRPTVMMSSPHRRAPSAFAGFITTWDGANASTSVGDFVARRLPSVGALVPARWRRNRVHSEDDVELGGVGHGGSAPFGAAAMARIDPESPFKSPTHADRKLFWGDEEAWRATARSSSAPNLAEDAGAGVFADCTGSPATLRRSSLSGMSMSPPRLVRQTTSNLSTESRPPRLRRTSVSLIREESGQTAISSEQEGGTGKWVCGQDMGAKVPRMEILRWQYVRRVLLPGGVLDKMRCRIEAAVADVELFSVFETSYPIAAALCKRPIRYALLLTVFLYAAMVYIDTSTLRSMGQVRSATHIRFRATRLRSGAPGSIAVPAVHSIGLMRDGCMIETGPTARMECTKGECVVDLGGAWDFNGFYFVPNHDTRAMDPVAFTLDAKSDAADGNWPEQAEWVRVGAWRRMVTLSGGQEWMMRRDGRDSSSGSEVVLASEHMHVRGHGAQPGSELARESGMHSSLRDAERDASAGMAPIVINSAGPPPSVGGAAVMIEMRAPWHAWLGSWALHLAAMGTAMALWYVSKIGRPGWGRALVVGALLCIACCLAVNAGAETVARGGASRFPLQWANAGVMMAIGVGLLVREQLALLLWLFSAVWYIVIYTVEDWLVHEMWGSGDFDTGLSSFPIAAFVFVLVGVFFVAMRRQLHIKSAQGIAQDMAEYREAWRQICADENERRELERVGNICSSVWAVTVANGGAQQRCRLKDVEFSNASSLRRSPSVGAAKVLDFFQSAWSASRKNSQASRRRRSSVFFGSSKPLALDTHTPPPSASKSAAPRSPPTLGTSNINVGLVRSPLPQKRDPDAANALALRTPESAVIRQPDSIAPSPSDAPSTSGTRVVMLSTVRRRSDAAAAAELRQRESARKAKGAVWSACLAMMGRGPSESERAAPASASSMATPQGAGSGSRWGFGSSRGSQSTARSGSLRRAGSSGGSWRSFRTFKFGWGSARKSNTSRSSGRMSRTGSWTVGGQGNTDGRLGTRRVQSLDQLYIQASGVYPLLKEKVKEWAWASRGCLRMKRDKASRNRKDSSLNGGHFERWDLLAGDANLERMVRWATLKKRQRASEKLVRSYQGKVWKLLDICRQSMVFDSVTDLADCIQLILGDPAVSVVSVKNRLALDYDDKETAGYRDVNINLCFQSEVAKQLGIDTHVCELQLLLRSFAELKTDDGHVRYVRFRNARAQ